MLIDIRCKHCRRLLARASKNFFGVIELRCPQCKITQQFSLAETLRQSPAQETNQSEANRITLRRY